MSVWPTMNTLAALAICSADTTTDCAMAATRSTLSNPAPDFGSLGVFH